MPVDVSFDLAAVDKHHEPARHEIREDGDHDCGRSILAFQAGQVLIGKDVNTENGLRRERVISHAQCVDYP
jgi:hypothetical protein